MLVIEKPGTYFTIAEAAEIKRVPAKTMYSWTKSGLPMTQDDYGQRGVIYIRAEDLEDYVPNRVGKPLGNVAKR